MEFAQWLRIYSGQKLLTLYCMTYTNIVCELGQHFGSVYKYNDIRVVSYHYVDKQKTKLQFPSSIEYLLPFVVVD